MTRVQATKGIAASLAAVWMVFWPLIAGAAVDTAPRVALVVGNGGYDPENISRLDNPVNDAELMAKALETVGFEVSLVTDANRDAMEEAIKEFGKQLKSEGREAVGLFYYAGHGVEARGDNYLIPLGAKIESELEFESRAVPAKRVMSWMEEAGNRLNILILDACRDNPYKGTRGGPRGLAPITSGPSGSLIAYSAAPGKVADDGDGKNSPYTLALAQTLIDPGLQVEEVFKLVRARVEEETGGSQTPWEHSALKGDFYFVPPQKDDVDPPPPPPPDEAKNAYETAAKENSIAAYQAVVEHYPGFYATLARQKIEDLDAAGPDDATSPSPEPVEKEEILVYHRVVIRFEYLDGVGVDDDQMMRIETLLSDFEDLLGGSLRALGYHVVREESFGEAQYTVNNPTGGFITEFEISDIEEEIEWLLTGPALEIPSRLERETRIRRDNLHEAVLNYTIVPTRAAVREEEEAPDTSPAQQPAESAAAPTLDESVAAYARGDYGAALQGIRVHAEQGDGWAQYILGLMYDNGDGVAEDDAEAVRWYRLAAEQDHALAQNALGNMYDNGDGVAEDDAEAVRWYRLAAEQGDAHAQKNLGLMYDRGEGVTADTTEAVRWYRRAAEQGHDVAQTFLGYMYANGRGVAEDDAEAVRWYRLAAEQGYVNAQTFLGLMYENGEGVAEDDAEAVRWYRKAAEQGYARAQYRLAEMYGNGEGVGEDDTEAVRWYRKAAEQGNTAAQNQLGLMLSKPVGVSYSSEDVAEDDSEAARWFRRAAEHGLVGAQYRLAEMYDNGEGVAQDYVQAAHWYRRAAEQGLAIAQYDLGLMYANGEGVAKDNAEAVRWFRRAAEQRNGAFLILGFMYAKGRGVAKDDAEAMRWYQRAIEWDDIAERDLERAAEERLLGMTDTQRGLVQRGLTELLPFEPNGFFGSHTRAAIRKWQASRGELVTGYLDADAAKTLIAAGMEDLLGLTWAQRQLVQRGLAALQFNPGPPDGVFGPNTRAAIRRWQASRGELVTGNLDAEAVEILLAADERVSVAGDPTETEPDPAGLYYQVVLRFEDMSSGDVRFTPRYDIVKRMFVDDLERLLVRISPHDGGEVNIHRSETSDLTEYTVRFPGSGYVTALEKYEIEKGIEYILSSLNIAARLDVELRSRGHLRDALLVYSLLFRRSEVLGDPGAAEAVGADLRVPTRSV